MRQGCPLSPSIFNLLIELLAEKIRAHSHIQVFSLQGSSHKINLFADDIILSITSPTNSLPHIQEVLESFGSVSYYKVNSSKSVILPMNLPSHISSTLKKSLPYSWAEKSISYLGLQLTADPSDLAGANFPPLLVKLTREAARLARTELSWSGRLASFKMLLLPQILYIFHTLPVPIKPAHMRALEMVLHRYVWNSHSPRCSKVLLVKHRSVGGMGFTDLLDNYRASLLNQVKSWLSGTVDTPWCNIERVMSPTKDFFSLLILDRWNPFPLHIHSGHAESLEGFGYHCRPAI